jgi:hypothetical protein
MFSMIFFPVEVLKLIEGINKNGGGSGTRTHTALRHTGFQDRPLANSDIPPLKPQMILYRFYNFPTTVIIHTPLIDKKYPKTPAL